MATATVTYPSLQNGVDSDANEINQNYADILSFLNTEVVHVDGAKAMTGALSLPASDPTGDNHAARKLYVDTSVAAGPPSQQLSQDASLGSDTVTIADDWQEWGSGGAQVVTIANPNRNVSVWAVLVGDATADADAGIANERVSISFDGGSTYTQGRVITTYIAGLQTQAFTVQHLRSGTPTGSIKAYAEINQTGGASGDVTWNDGSIVVLVIPT